jgi:DNA polymerase (family 10)
MAQECVRLIERLTPRVEVAGSIRRRRERIGDIDLVLLDWTEANPWQHAQIASELGLLGYEPIKDGDKIASFRNTQGRAGLDLYYATPETWGITLLCRTGSAAHNIKLVDVGKRLLPARFLQVSRGIVDTADRVVAGATEEGIFHALGLEYVEPEKREAPEFQHLVGGE